MQLLQLELGIAGGGESEAAGTRLTLSCMPGAVRISARELGTRRELSRDVAVAPDNPDAERVLAISAAQLVRALAWLPQDAAEDAPKPRPKPPPSYAGELGPKDPAKFATSARVEAGVGARARSLKAQLVSLRVGLAYDWGIARSLHFGVGVGYESGGADRRIGSVDARLLGGGLRLAWTLLSARPVALELRGEAAVERAWLTGAPSQPGFRGGELSGVGGEAGVDFGPTFRLGLLSVRLSGQVGAAYFGGQGLVSGEEAIDLNGPWAGCMLALAWAPSP